MPITVYKTFIPGEVLTASDLNSSFSQLADNASSVTELNRRLRTQDTTASFILSSVYSDLATDTVIETLGYTTQGDGGGALWRKTGVSGLTTSQTPADLVDGKLVDAGGHEWEIVQTPLNVKALGCKGDNTSDDLAALKACVAFVVGTQPTGGGSLYFPKGIYRTSGPLEIYSDIKLYGDGLTATYIKPLDSATFAANQAVIQSIDFDTVQGTDIWEYYSPYPNGLVMGFSISNMTIDANRANVANAGGLYVYGGKWSFRDIGVINTSAHGIWTEAGTTGSSTSGNDLHDFLNMHEAFSTNIYIANADQHGWYYRGPNDSSIGDVQIKTCGWAGFFQESTGDNSIGNLEIRSLHAYSCTCGHGANGAMIELESANVQFIYVDASLKNGLRLYDSACIIDQVLVLKNNANNAGSFWGVICDVASQINMIRNSETTARTSGTDGGLLQVNSASTVIGQVRTVQVSTTTIAQKAIEINAYCSIGLATIEAYDSAGSIGVDVSSSRVCMTVQARSCLNAVDYNTSGRNCITINADLCTTDITYNVAASDSDYINLLTSNKTRNEVNTGKVISSAASVDITTIASTTSYTIDAAVNSYIRINGLAHNITFNAPSNPTNGDVIDIFIQQDGTGGRTITWNSAFKTGYSDTGNSAFTRHSITFVYDGSFWVERSKTGWY